MGTKLYIGNLPFSASSSTLESLFAPIGKVESVNIITDRDSGRSKGFAFVEMSSQAEAEQCISRLNGQELEGRQITVAEARPQAPRGDRFGGGGSGPRRSGGGGGFNKGNRY
jgi:cold-inducible RNA-binding protein